MRIIVKLLLVIFVIGLVMAVTAFFMGLDIQGLSRFFNDDESYGEQIVFTQNEEVTGIDLSSETRNVTVSVTDEDFMTVSYHAHEKDTWVLGETDGILTMTQTQEFEFFNFMSFKTVSAEIRTVYIEIPQAWELDLSIHSNVGIIRVEFESVMTHHEVSIQSNTGKVYLKNLDVESVDIELDTGSTSMINVTIENDLNIDTNTGTINIENLVARHAYVASNTGNISLNEVNVVDMVADNNTGRITSEHVIASNDIIFKTSTGKIILKDTTAASFDLRASTGDIEVDLESLEDIRFDLKATVGNIKVDGVNQGDTHSTSSGSIIFIARVTTGNITIDVQE